MLRGIYASASGMLADQRRLEVTANNLANAATTGYKRDTSITQSFGELFLQRINDANPAQGNDAAPVGPVPLGAYVAHTATRLSTGSLQATGNPLDVAILGDGFFTVNTPEGVRYTRSGNFVQDDEGNLVTPEGYNVLVDNQPLTSAEPLKLNDKGEVQAGDQVLGKLTIATSAELGALRKEGNGLWSMVDREQSMLLTPEISTGRYQVKAGYLEGSNVQPVNEMMEMMAVMRSYEANQRAIHAQDETLSKAVTEVARI
jgi:flagellar basal-body rod protein FlgF